MTRIYQTEGLKSLWRGNLVNCLKIIPSTTLNIYLYKIFKENRPQLRGNKNIFYKNFETGARIGIATFLIFPLEQIQTRLSSDIAKTKKYNGIKDLLNQTMKSPNGCFGFYKGFGTFLFYRILFLSMLHQYEKSITTLNNQYKFIKRGPTEFGYRLERFVIYQITYMISAFATWPYLTIANRFKLLADVPNSNLSYKFKFTKEMIKREGYAFLFKGFKIVPLQSVVFSLSLMMFEKILH